jgi:hypothetical protein
MGDYNTTTSSLLAELYLLQEAKLITFFMYIAEDNQKIRLDWLARSYKIMQKIAEYMHSRERIVNLLREGHKQAF